MTSQNSSTQRMEGFEIQWDDVEKELIEFWSQAIRRFASEHPDVEVYYAALGFSMQSGKVHVSFDDFENNVRSEQVIMEWANEHRGKRMSWPDPWKSIRYALSSPRIDGVQCNPSDFRFNDYAVHQFSAAPLIHGYHDLYLENPEMNEYVPGNLALVTWKVYLSLQNAGIFRELRRANPFFIGYCIGDNPVNLCIERS